MSTVYFISDAHLGLGDKTQDKEKERRLIDFFDAIMRDANQLFILGDLFDAWIEYRTVIPKGHHRLLTKLEDLTLHGISVHYLAGNHDFWMRDFFQKELGIKTYLEPIETKIDEKRFYLHHGDGFANNDGGYRLLKKVLRNPAAIWLYTWIHPDIGYGIARSTSQKSRTHTSVKDYGEDDGMVKSASKIIQSGIDIVIMGHRHRPLYQKIDNGIYVNLGDWMEFNTYAIFSNGNIELKTWKS
ncbi:MAG: UDP-2,3-diacylglucosamine diphosphatase [Bacteroidota bacterium]